MCGPASIEVDGPPERGLEDESRVLLDCAVVEGGDRVIEIELKASAPRAFMRSLCPAGAF